MGTKLTTILVVDADRTIRTLVGAFLEDAGYTVLVAADAGEIPRIFAPHSKEFELTFRWRFSTAQLESQPR
jgi:DNA-binding response OmpR family regulator